MNLVEAMLLGSVVMIISVVVLFAYGVAEIIDEVIKAIKERSDK